jgi:hypothetical protein
MLRSGGDRERRRKCLFAVAPLHLCTSAPMHLCTVASFNKKKRH